jgi:hypothetical protein
MRRECATKGLTLDLKFAFTVIDPPPLMTVPIAGIPVDVKTPLLSNTVVVIPSTLVEVRL